MPEQGTLHEIDATTGLVPILNRKDSTNNFSNEISTIQGKYYSRYSAFCCYIAIGTFHFFHSGTARALLFRSYKVL